MLPRCSRRGCKRPALWTCFVCGRPRCAHDCRNKESSSGGSAWCGCSAPKKPPLDGPRNVRLNPADTPPKRKKGERDDVYFPRVALAVFGTTDDPREAGYILPDGTMLDFSGKTEGGPAGTRSYDHRDIGRAIGDGGTDGMLMFMSEANAARVHFTDDTMIIDLDGTEPTYAQRRAVQKAWLDLGRPSNVNVDYGIIGGVQVGRGVDVFSAAQFERLIAATPPDE